MSKSVCGTCVYRDECGAMKIACRGYAEDADAVQDERDARREMDAEQRREEMAWAKEDKEETK